MELTEFKYNSIGGVDAKLNHPIYGFIDYTLTNEEVEKLDPSIEIASYVSDNKNLTDIISMKSMELKAQRIRLELSPINGISVEKTSHREDIEKYANVLALYSASSEEDRAQYTGMLNTDGSINWTLADDTVRAVTEAELRQTLLTFLIRKATLMKKYQDALARLNASGVKTASQINAITLEVSNV